MSWDAPTSWKCQCGVDVPMGCSHSCGTWPPTPPSPSYAPPPLPTAQGTVIVTTRSVPVPCEVCGKRGWRSSPFEEDNPDDEGMRCDACDGKGWLKVTETTTTRV